MTPALPPRGNALAGIAAVAAAWLVFALHDASIKLLVADLSAWQVLCARSLVILPVVLLAGGRRQLAPALQPGIRGWLLLNAVIYAAAWIAYYSAARDLQLAELESIYYAAPLVTMLLAALLLHERVPAAGRISAVVGFAGVILACQPAGAVHGRAVALALLAAVLWAGSVVLMRKLSCTLPSLVQMLVNNAAFLVMCLIALPWWWQAPELAQLPLLLAVGAAGAVAQYLLYEGIRRAPASVVAPIEYTGLAWAFALGFLIWGDIPAPAVFAGAGLIALSGAILIASEIRAARRPADPSSGLAAASPAAGS